MSFKIPRSLAYLSAAVVVAGLALSGPSFAKSGSSNKNKTILWLMSTGADPGATAKVTFEQKDPNSTLRVELRSLPIGAYDLAFDGTVQATITVKKDNSGSGETKGEVRFDSKKGLPLDFDPIGLPVTVSQGLTMIFSDTFPAVVGPIPDTELKLDLINSGTIPAASGNAEAKLRNGRTDFNVEIEDVPAGDYNLQINGVSVGTITAAVRAGQKSIKGEVEFSSDVDQIGHVPLTFDPHGAIIEVFQGSTMIFSLTFPTIF